jgi:hypothetical protein
MTRRVESRRRLAAIGRLALAVPRREGDPAVWIGHSREHTTARWCYSASGPCVYVIGTRRLGAPGQTVWYYGQSDPDGASHRYRVECPDGLAAVVRGAIDGLWVREGRVTE